MIAESLTPIPELENKIGTELTTFALERFARNWGINRQWADAPARPAFDPERTPTAALGARGCRSAPPPVDRDVTAPTWDIHRVFTKAGDKFLIRSARGWLGCPAFTTP